MATSPQPTEADIMCCVCPFCPAAESDCVYASRSALMQHHRSSTNRHKIQDQGSKMPPDSQLQWVIGRRVIWHKKLRMIRVSAIEKPVSLQLPPFSLEGFRFQSKLELALELSTKHDAHRYQGSFENRTIQADLKYFKDAKCFIQRVGAAVKKSRYYLRRLAKRKEDGLIPVAGFNVLKCSDSENAYSRTLARLIFFVIAENQFLLEAKNLQEAITKNEPVEQLSRASNIDNILWELLSEKPSARGFTCEKFLELLYVYAPNGPIQKSAQSVHQHSVQLLYILRGAFLIKCHTVHPFCSEQEERWSKQYLNEQGGETSFGAVQSLKRAAARNIEDTESRISWVGDSMTVLAVATERGSVEVSLQKVSIMYQHLVNQARTILQNMGIDVLSSEICKTVIDCNTKIPGEGIMSLNAHIAEEIALTNRNIQLHFGERSDKDRLDFCQLSTQLGVTLVKALYFAGGPSARLTEMGAWLISNTMSNSQRNIRFISGLIGIVNTYTKPEASGASGKKELVVCFTDMELTKIVLTYLIIVKRIEARHSSVFGKEATVNSQCCFLINKGKPVEAETLGKLFRTEFLLAEVDVTIADMRHILEALARASGCLLESDVAIQNPLLRMANHSDNVSSRVYGKCQGVDLPGVPADRMRECFIYCEHWNQFVLKGGSIGSSYCTSLSSLSALSSSSSSSSSSFFFFRFLFRV